MESIPAHSALRLAYWLRRRLAGPRLGLTRRDDVLAISIIGLWDRWTPLVVCGPELRRRLRANALRPRAVRGEM